MEFIGTVFKTILSPLQKARAIVQSYPFYPDVYQVGGWVGRLWLAGWRAGRWAGRWVAWCVCGIPT
jgi:hypothetical protein